MSLCNDHSTFFIPSLSKSGLNKTYIYLLRNNFWPWGFMTTVLELISKSTSGFSIAILLLNKSHLGNLLYQIIDIDSIIKEGTREKKLSCNAEIIDSAMINSCKMTELWFHFFKLIHSEVCLYPNIINPLSYKLNIELSFKYYLIPRYNSPIKSTLTECSRWQCPGSCGSVRSTLGRWERPRNCSTRPWA